MTIAVVAPSARRTKNVRWQLWISGVMCALLVLLAILAPWLAPYDPTTSSVLNTLRPPSPEHLLGTDSAGRDLLSRLIHGSRTALLGPVVVVVVATTLGTLLAIVAAWRRGWADALIGRGFDMTFSFPDILLALMFVAVLSPNLWSATLAVSIAFIPAIGRLVRASALREVNAPYVEALYSQGQSAWRICFRHILPNLRTMIMAQATTAFGYAMVTLAGLSFLGLGVQEPAADWGKMIQAGQGAIVRGFPQESLYAGVMLVIAVISFISLGDALTSKDENRK